MRHLINPLIIAASFAFSGAAFAQSADENTSSESSNAEASASEDGGVPGLSMGTEEARAGQPYTRDTFGAWELRCVQADARGEICQLYQLLRDAEGNSVAEFNLFPLPEGQEAVAGANIVTPLETLLTANLRLSVDGGAAKRYPYSFCSQVGCFARIGLTSAELDTFRKGANANVTIVPAAAPNETVGLTLSLSGFTAGFKALVETENARNSSQ